MDKNLSSLVKGLVPVAELTAVKPDLARPLRALMMKRSRRVVHVDPNGFHPTAVAAWTKANSWAAAVAPRALKAASQKKEKKKQKPKEIITIDDGTVSTGMTSATTQAAIAKTNETIARFKINEKESQIKISALDITIARIATSVVRITESQDHLTKGYVSIQESFAKMAAANEATQHMLQEFFTSKNIISQSTSIIMADSENTEMESTIAGKRGAEDIAKSPGHRTRSQSRNQASRLTSSQSGATLPCALFLATETGLSNSAMSNSPNSSETQSSGGE